MTRRLTFHAYQIDLHYTIQEDGKDKDRYKWDSSDFVTGLKGIFNQTAHDRQRKYNGWFVVLEKLVDQPQTDDTAAAVYGYFKYAEYGSKSDLIHADTLVSRENPRDIREGEEQFIHFYVRLSDGLLLLQGHQRFTQFKFAEYLEELGKTHWESKNYTFIHVASLLDLDFFDRISELDKVKGIYLEVSRDVPGANDNEVITTMQNAVGEVEGTHVQLRFTARYKRGGLTGVIPFVNKYRNKSGITNIKVEGEKGGASQTVSLNGYREKYVRQCETDQNNNPKSDNVFQALVDIGNRRVGIPRRQ